MSINRGCDFSGGYMANIPEAVLKMLEHMWVNSAPILIDSVY